MRQVRLLPVLIFSLQIVFFTNGMKIPQKQDPLPELKWWDSGIIYQVYPRSHQDSNGDGIGDLAGIQSRLDHFVELGIQAVWISPIYQSPMADFGYDISNFTDIAPVFGTLDDFRNLSDAMKERNIKLVMDFVPNHSSDEHVWFNRSVNRIEPYTDYYVWKDAKGFEIDGTPIPPNNWVSVFGGSMWTWNDIRQQFYLHQFVAKQPDLNYENPKVLTEILAAIKFWLDMGVDGFRVDAVPHMFEDQRYLDEPADPNAPEGSLPDEYRYYLHPYTYNLPKVLDALAEIRQLIDIYTAFDGKDRCMMVEATIPNLDDLFLYYGTESRPIAHFPFNFEFINRIKPGFNGTDILSMVDEWFQKMPPGATANWLVGNHDNHRVSKRFGDYIVDPLNMLIHLLPGSSVTYYGEEIGMQDTWISWVDTVDPAGCNAGEDRYELFSRDPERTPMQWDATKSAGFSTADRTWLPIHYNYTILNVAAQSGSDESHLEIYKKVELLRRSNAFKFGSLETKAPNDGAVFAFSRIYNSTGFIMLANFGDAQETVNASLEFEDIPAIARVYTRSQGFVPEGTFVGSSINTNEIVIGARHSLIVEF
ncbi:alpha-glucosidase isoform X1 [Folsomia candida]|uniref:alpha-glucosidase isoform X1 n=2 Tax=Folsomia candida TaxID=158441 RepID=UPI000B9048AF|nr:alpha-glucosidase isoform X1 [Folsomia candida]